MYERDIEKKVKAYARLKGLLAYKFTSPGHAFVPDGIFVTPDGDVFFIEFKRLGLTPSPGQLREIERIRGHKVFVHVVDSVAEGIKVIDAYCQ